MKESIYIAGKMRGIPFYNFPAFDAARDRLKADGWKIVRSPADMDRAIGFDALKKKWPEGWDWNMVPADFNFKHCIERDIRAVRKSDAILMLEGWEKSAGARAEHAIACWCKKKILIEEMPLLIEANELINGDRNADYGPPNQDFKRTADMWTGLLQYKLNLNAKIRPQDVALMMIMLKASRAQHSLKKDNYIDICGYGALAWRCARDEA